MAEFRSWASTYYILVISIGDVEKVTGFETALPQLLSGPTMSEHCHSSIAQNVHLDLTLLECELCASGVLRTRILQ